MKKVLLFACFAVVLAGSSMAQFSIQKVVFEEFTGAWCQYCADGAYRAEVMDGNFPDALMIAVHVGDAMDIPEGADTLNNYYAPAFPQALFNRSGALVSRGSWGSTMSSSLQGASVVTVSFDSVAYDAQNRTVTAVVRALFTGPETGDLRLSLAVTEDEVTGTGSGYNQVNADNSTPGHPYQGAGNPILGFVHKHVVRDYLGGTWGLGGIIPGTVNLGTAATHTFTYTIPANFDESKIELVAFVSKIEGTGVNDRTILNGEEFDLSSLVVGRPEMTAATSMIEILGNPLQERSKIIFTTEEAGNFKLEVLNMLGQQVAVLGEGFTDKGIHTLYWHGTNSANVPVDNGMYLVRLVTESGKSQSKRVLVAH
jgi:hypothetical protein